MGTIFYVLSTVFVVAAADARYVLRIETEKVKGWASDFDPMCDAVMKITKSTGKTRITLVPDPFTEHSCSEKELTILEGVFPDTLAKQIVERIQKDNVQLWFARDIMSYAAKYLKVI